MTIIKEVSIADLDTWSGATDTKDTIIDNDKESEFDSMIEELYPDGIEETTLNDILWHDSDWVYEVLNIEID